MPHHAASGEEREATVEQPHITVQDDSPSHLSAQGRTVTADATIGSDGRLSISFLLKHAATAPPDLPEDGLEDGELAGDDLISNWKDVKVPKLQIVMHIVGSRGDVQPFLSLGQALQKEGHRVRVGTHGTFKSFVEGADLEHFDIGGDPEALMSYMVKNPGLIPGMESLKNGDIGRQKKMLAGIMQGCYRSCYEEGQGRFAGQPFAADLIIANPPSFAHVHLAEAFGLPLHVVFTFPYGPPTTAFPHPLVNVTKSELTDLLTNYVSYNLFDMFTFQGLRGIINEFRSATLDLQALSSRSGQGLVDRLELPWTYLWNASLLPKPKDWRRRPIDIVGFMQTYAAPSYTPPEDLTQFLRAGSKPIYVGFGSIPVEDSKAMTASIFAAAKKANVRICLSSGWAKLGADVETPENVFILGDVPHDWLFHHMAAAVHHGGSGTTCASLKASLPTLIVPFFGDQFHWGQVVHARGAGPEPIPAKILTGDNLAAAFQELLKPELKTAAEGIAASIKADDGVKNAVRSIYRHLPLDAMRCHLLPNHTAQWVSQTHGLVLSGAAAETLVQAGKLDYMQLIPHRARRYQTRVPTSDPITGGVSSVLELVLDYHQSMFEQFWHPSTGIRRHGLAIPMGLAKTWASMDEGFHHAPKLWGSQIRARKQPTDFVEGIGEATKGVIYGFADPVMDLVKEPMRGAKQEGALGVVKGFARAGINFGFKPAAGIMGTVTLPVQGLITSCVCLCEIGEPDAAPG